MLTVNRTFLKTVSVFLLLNLLGSTLAPTISFALTAGPTAPEFTSFEPVDTTDMVNLLTGDLVYNLPLLEVPGPEGGYSMSLSYHADARPDEESSWVGLGWTLNPGAINRNVDGAPDDVRQNKIVQTRFVDVGGGKVEYVDVMGTRNGIGTIFTAHNFEGYGGSGAALALVKDGSPDQTFRGTDAPLGGQHDGIRRRLSTMIALAKNRGYYMFDGDPSNGEVENADTKYSMKVVPIPNIPSMYIDVKSNYWRWYRKYEGELKSKGALYASESLAISSTNSSDAYKLFTNADLLTDGTIADKHSYGSLPSNDFYNVSAQGLNGSIRPYNFENGSLILQSQSTLGQDTNDFGYTTAITHKDCRAFTKKGVFRFDGDFSNALSITPERITFNTDMLTGGTVNAHALSVNYAGYNNVTQQLAGSRQVDWYTVNQVNNGYAKSKGLIRYNNVDNQYVSGTAPFLKFSHTDTSTIAGFKIINEDGTTYHYSLPVYAYDEVYTIRAKGNSYARIETQTKNPYAYEWLLTAITGNDYVDRNNNGLVDEADWGYWTAFDYGKWTDKYMWRSPVDGYNVDIDGSNETCTSGLKEIYYLDAIRTRTHTALFVKSIKNDGKGVRGRDGGVGRIPLNGVTGTCSGGNYNGTYYSVSIASMKLDKIYLIPNTDLTAFLTANGIGTSNLTDLKAKGTTYNDTHFGQSFCSVGGGSTGYYINFHMGDNVLDKNDLTTTQFNDLKKASLKIIELITSYSLCPATPNSFNVADNYAYDIVFTNPLTKTGKLTLEAVKVYGKGGADLMPAYNFDYNFPSALKAADFRITQIDNGTGIPNILYFGTTAPAGITGGEVMKFTYNSLDYYVAIGKINATEQGPPGTGVYTYTSIVNFLGTNMPTAGMVNQPTYFHGVETRNPPFGGEMLDIWGRFKPDYIKGFSEVNNNKKVTNASLNSCDIWNLRAIETPVGSKIKITYEPDSYLKPKSFNNYLYDITSMTAVPGSSTDVVIGGLSNDGTNLTTVFTVGNRCNFIALLQTPATSGTVYEEILDYTTQEAEIIAVTSNTITIRATDLADKLKGCYTADFSNPVGNTCSNSFIGGKLKYYKTGNIMGGGLRVKSLVVEGSGLNKETNFNYESSPGITSGVTTFEPFAMDSYNMTFPSVSGVPYYELQKKKSKGRDAYLKALFAEFSDVLKFSRMLPAPGVMYEFVTVTEKANGIEYYGKTKYHFQVFENSMIKVSQNAILTGDPNPSNYKRNYINTIKNNTSRIGQLKAVLVYDNTGKIVKRIENKYLHDHKNQADFETALASLYNNQGKISESFNEYKIVSLVTPSGTNTQYAYAVTNLVEDFPSIPVKRVESDLVKGIKSEIQYLAYDFYSGRPTKQFYKNSYGEGYVSETVPAYIKHPEMGLKVIVPSNRHMLTQSAASYVYKADSNGNSINAISAEITTWNKVGNYRMYNTSVKGNYYTGTITDDPATIQNEQIYRPYRTYVYNSPLVNSDGTIQNFVDFNWSQEASDQPQYKYWQKTQEATLYDPFSNMLETKDINGNYSSIKKGYKGSEILIAADNSRYTEMAFSGAEDDALELDAVNNYSNYYGGEVSLKTLKSNLYAHTGKYSMAVNGAPKLLYHINNNSNGRTDFYFLKNYRAAIWVHKNLLTQAKLSYVLSNDADNSTISTASAVGNTNLAKAGDWYLLTLDFSIPYTAISSVSLKIFIENTGAGDVYFDDFRFHPFQSNVQSYVYDPQTKQITHILDNENFYTRFEYDPFGRLLATYKETLNGEKKVKDYFYNYALKP